MLVNIDMTFCSIITRITAIIVTVLIFTSLSYVHTSQALGFLNVAKDARIEPPALEFFLVFLYSPFLCEWFRVLGV